MPKCLPPSSGYSLDLFLKLSTSFLIGSVYIDNLTIFCVTFSSETIFGFRWSCQKASSIAPPNINIQQKVSFCWFSETAMTGWCTTAISRTSNRSWLFNSYAQWHQIYKLKLQFNVCSITDPCLGPWPAPPGSASALQEGFKPGELGSHCSFSIICGHLARTETIRSDTCRVHGAPSILPVAVWHKSVVL